MKRLIIVILAAGAVMFTATSVASAAPINECGSWNWKTKGWTYGPVPSGYFLGNLTTRNVSCGLARKLVRSANGLGAYGFRCRTTTLGDEYWDVRCTASRGGVIRYQTGV